MTAAHSGFGHKYSECGIIFARRDSKHGCRDYSLSIVKRSTHTFAGEEASEFENFQKSRSKFCIPFMKIIKPNVPNQPSGKRANPTQPHHMIPKKRQKYTKYKKPTY
jgi:hypothetical protein